MAAKKINYRDVLARRLPNLESSFVLDAGTGAGNMTKVLSDYLSRGVVSADRNRYVLPAVRKRVDRRKVDFVTCDFASLPFRDESFCCIVCDLVISTSRDWQPTKIFTEFRRALGTKGILYITDYYPERSPKGKEERLAAETRKFYREVSEAMSIRLRRDFSPEEAVEDLRKTGFRNVSKQTIVANETALWKKRVFAEYYSGMKRMISSLRDPKLKTRLRNELETLRKRIVTGREIHWGWGANYLIEAQK